MQVLSVCRLLPDPDKPSAGQFVVRRLQGMAEHANVRVVQPIPFTPLVRPLPPWARPPERHIGPLTVTHAPMFYLPGVLKRLDGYWLASATRRMVQSARNAQGVDVIDAHFAYPDGVGCVRVGEALGVPVFVTLRGVEVDQLKRPSIASQIVSALNRAAGCISVSHSLRDTAIAAGVEPHRIRVIGNAIDRSSFSPGDRTEARRALGLAPDGKLIVSVGNLIELKRHHVLIESFARLKQSHPDLQMAILGGGEPEPDYERRLDALIAAQGLGGSVRLVGQAPPSQVISWLRAANVFALATSREGCCNAVLEALACGIPVVTTPAGDNAYFVRDDVNGKLVPIDDAAALQAALQQVLNRGNWDPAQISRSLTVGDWSHVGHEVLDYFRETLARGAGR